MIGQLAYIVILAVAWIWGLSQAAYAIRAGFTWPPVWRMIAALWMVGKAVFLSYVVYHTWRMIPDHAPMVVTFAVIHATAYAYWVRLPAEDRPVAVVRKPVDHGPDTTRGRRW